MELTASRPPFTYFPLGRHCQEYLVVMSRASALLAAVTSEPTSTSELYDRIGYPSLTRLGLVPYDAFRAELARLSAAGMIDSHTAGDGSTMWRLAADGGGTERN